MQNATASMEDDIFVISRVFDIPRETMYTFWTDPKHMEKWWGPKGFTVISQKLDFQPGGTYLYGIRSPEGVEMWGKFTYREITPPARLLFTNGFSDANGGVTRHPFSPNWPLQLLTTVTFEEAGAGKTNVTVQWQPQNATPEERRTFIDGKPGMQQGWGGTFEQLAGYIATLG